MCTATAEKVDYMHVESSALAGIIMLKYGSVMIASIFVINRRNYCFVVACRY